MQLYGEPTKLHNRFTVNWKSDRGDEEIKEFSREKQDSSVAAASDAQTS